MSKPDKVKIRYINHIKKTYSSIHLAYFSMSLRSEAMERLREYFHQNTDKLIKYMDSFDGCGCSNYRFNSALRLVRHFIAVAHEYDGSHTIQYCDAQSIVVKKRNNGDYDISCNDVVMGIILMNVIPNNMFGITWVFEYNFDNTVFDDIAFITSGEETKIHKCVAISGEALNKAHPYMLEHSHIFDTSNTTIFHNPRINVYYYSVSDEMLDLMTLTGIEIKVFHNVLSISDSSSGDLDGMTHTDFITSMYMATGVDGHGYIRKTIVSIKEP